MNQSYGLYLILTNPIAGYEACAKAAVEEGIAFLQLRMKEADPHLILDTARRVRRITLGSNTLFIVNDNLEIAMQADADGIHLGQDDMPIEVARKQWNTAGKLFGLSTHSLAQAKEAECLKPDYIGVGPVFPTGTKTDADPVLGVSETARIMQEVSMPAFAIGGITAENLPALIYAGIHNFCAVGAVSHSPDPAAAIRRLQAIRQSGSFSS